MEKKKVTGSKNVIIGNLEKINNVHVGDSITKIYQVLGLQESLASDTDIWKSVERSCLYKELEAKAIQDENVNRLIVIIKVIYTYSAFFEELEGWKEESLPLTKQLLALFDLIIPKEVLVELNEIEICVLILSAVVQNTGFSLRIGDTLSNVVGFEDFVEDNEDLYEVTELVKDSGNSDEAVLMFRFLERKFLSRDSQNRTTRFVKDTFEGLFTFNGSSFLEELLQVSTSFNVDSWEFGFKKQVGRSSIDAFRRDKKVCGLNCNIQYLSICSKIVNLLAFNDVSHPSYFLNYFSVGEDVLFSEWHTHLDISYWYINGRDLVYECVCAHPVYQNYLIELLDSIEQEIDKCSFLLSDNPDAIIKKYGSPTDVRLS